jgi:nicotinamidase-related amidase
MSDPILNLKLRKQELTQDGTGHNQWAVVTTELAVPAAETALVICDLWDNHWSRGAAERVNAMVAYFNDVVCAARERGVLIVHAPSETLAFYAGTPARQRALSAPAVELPANLGHADPPLPIDDSDGGSDTGETDEHIAWSRQHPAIQIDQQRDVITDNGREVYNVLRQRGIRQVLLCGVHTNMCVLNRSFAIKQMVRWGVPVTLIRDLTDTMYNPALRPYVSHAEGTRLVIEYIEKFWCATIESRQVLG